MAEPWSEIDSAAFNWWIMRRPKEYDIEQHVKNPTINCITDAEKRLALAVRDLAIKK